MRTKNDRTAIPAASGGQTPTTVEFKAAQNRQWRRGPRAWAPKRAAAGGRQTYTQANGETMITFRSIIVALLFFPTVAFGQSAVSQAGPPSAGHAPMYLNSSGGQTFVQDSGAARGGANGVGLSELLLSARGTGMPPYAGQGTGPYGTNFCDYDAPITNATGYHFLCLSANANGGGLLAVGYSGGASPLPFSFNLNGASYQFPFTIGGIVGPSTTTINDFACWNNTTGSLLKDCSLGVNTPLVGATAGYGLYVGTGGSAGKLEQFPYGTNVFLALQAALNSASGLAPVASPTLLGTTEFTGAATTVNLQSPPANIFAVSSGGATIQTCDIVGCIPNTSQSTAYMRGSTLLAAPISEYLFLLDNQSNTGLSPDWVASTPYGAAWVTAHVYPANSYVVNAGNLYSTAIGATSGATAPTCTGSLATCSDGAITWNWLSATPTLFYIIGPTTGNLYSASVLGTSGVSEPVCGSGACSDGSIIWTYVNSGMVANKIGGASTWVTGPNTANGTWNWAFDSVWNADNPFMTGIEFDVTKNGQLDCAPGVLNCYNTYYSGGTNKKITAEIGMSAGTVGNPAAYWGMLLQGPYLAVTADIGIEDNAPIGIGFGDLYAASHSTATIQDNSTSPIGYWANGIYAIAPFVSADGASTLWGVALGAVASGGSSISSQAVVFGYYNAGSVAQNMTWYASDGAMNLAGSESNPAIKINGSLGVSCTGAPTSSFAAVGGIVTHC